MGQKFQDERKKFMMEEKLHNGKKFHDEKKI